MADTSGNDRKLYLEFVETRTRGVVMLYWKHAPETCAALWKALQTPIRSRALHAMFAGPEVMMGLPEHARNFDPTALPRESQAVNAGVGELLWFYQPANFFKSDPSEFWEIGLFYDEGGRTFGPTGWIPCTFFGRMTEGLDAVAAQCRRIRTEGAKTIELGHIAQ